MIVVMFVCNVRLFAMIVNSLCAMSTVSVQCNYCSHLF